MFKLLSINLLPIIIMYSLFFYLTQYTGLNDSGDIALIQNSFVLFTPFLLLLMNYKLAVKKEKTSFIPNFILILISSLLGVVLAYLNWGIDVQNDIGGTIFQNTDAESYGIVQLEAIFNVIVSILGSLLCSNFLIVKNRKKGTRT